MVARKIDAIPPLQTALVGLEDGSIGLSTESPVPELEDDQILVRILAVAVNPVDTKMTGALCSPGAVSGMDFAGNVLAIGENAQPPTPLKVGDRVCGAVQGMHSLTPRVGAFAEYTCSTAHVTMKIPDHLSFEEGASLGSGIGTIGIALFNSLQVPGKPFEPASKQIPVLVYGGSTATGTIAIQLLKLSGLRPIATCSPKNFDLVKSYGAEAVYDYRSPTCIQDIKTHTRNSLKYILDCISEAETMQFCYECMGRTGGRYTSLEPYPEWLHTRQSVKPDWVLGPTLLGKPIGWRPPFERAGDKKAKEFAVEWFKAAQKLLDEKRLRPHPIKVMPGGLSRVLEGMVLLRKKQISGEKMVYTIAGP